MDINNSNNNIAADNSNVNNPIVDDSNNSPTNEDLQKLVKKVAPAFPLRRPGQLSRGPIMGRGKGGGLGNKGRIGMRTGTR